MFYVDKTWYECRGVLFEWLSCLSGYLSILNCACGKRSRNSVSLWLAMHSTRFLKSQARDFTTFTLHDLTDFYVERATAPHYNYQIIIHVFIAAGQIQKQN